MQNLLSTISPFELLGDVLNSNACRNHSGGSLDLNSILIQMIKRLLDIMRFQITYVRQQYLTLPFLC